MSTITLQCILFYDVSSNESFRLVEFCHDAIMYVIKFSLGLNEQLRLKLLLNILYVNCYGCVIN